MSSPTSAAPSRIGIYGSDGTSGQETRGFNLWPIGYAGAVSAAGATPVVLHKLEPGEAWKEVLADIDGLVISESLAATPRQCADEEQLVKWCRQHNIPVLGVDQGMHLLNATFGGTTYEDLARELPEALQHRHPPEKGLRHAITVNKDTRLAELYGEGEVVVNSEHRQAVQRLARGFCVSARALDGVVEAIELEGDSWFALGVQWHPASASASGLDIQLFRGLVDASQAKGQESTRGQKVVAAA
jgi:putative glutamine amidotransferase